MFNSECVIVLSYERFVLFGLNQVLDQIQLDCPSGTMSNSGNVHKFKILKNTLEPLVYVQHIFKGYVGMQNPFLMLNFSLRSRSDAKGQLKVKVDFSADNKWKLR